MTLVLEKKGKERKEKKEIKKRGKRKLQLEVSWGY